MTGRLRDWWKSGRCCLVLAFFWPFAAWAEEDFFAQAAALPGVEAAIAVAAEGSALSAVAAALGPEPVPPRIQAELGRLVGLVRRATEAELRQVARRSFAVAMTEEQAAALVDLHATPEGAALVESLASAMLALRQEGAGIAEAELARAGGLLQSILERR